MRAPISSDVRMADPSASSGQAGDCSDGRKPAAFLYLATLAILLCPPFLVASDCLSIGQAAQHVGETKCITGKVLHVKAGAKGTHFLGSCEERAASPFSVVVFGSD